MTTPRPTCRHCSKPVDAAAALDPCPPDPMAQSVVHSECARIIRLEMEEGSERIRKAAPDLLAAAEEVAPLLGQFLDNHLYMRQPFNRLMDAIRKARGTRP